jgi:hypothetical protein
MMSLEEWASYIQTLAGEPLWSKVLACNTQSFADSLLEEGHSMADVQEILLYFVRQIKAVGLKVPEVGMVDLMHLSLTDPVCQALKPMPQAMADALEAAAIKADEAEAARSERETD